LAKRRLRKDSRKARVPGPRKRSIPQYGEKDDAGKWYRCWFCTQLCNIDREELGGTEAAHGSRPTASFTTPTNVARPGVPGDENSSKLVVKFHGQPKWVILRAEDDGTATTYKNEWVAAGVGCPFCFTRAWK
jgi:hypothetical protein